MIAVATGPHCVKCKAAITSSPDPRIITNLCSACLARIVPPGACRNCLRPAPCECREIGGEPAAFMDGRHAGWMRVWAAIATRWGGVTCLDVDSGETWQYMGTYRGQHQFRHRRLFAPEHPEHGQRVNFSIPVEPGDFRVRAETRCALCGWLLDERPGHEAVTPPATDPIHANGDICRMCAAARYEPARPSPAARFDDPKYPRGIDMGPDL